MSGSRRKRAYRALTLLWALGTAALLLLPSEGLPGAEMPAVARTAMELAAHVVLFFALAWLAARGFSDRSASAGAESTATPVGPRRGVFTAVAAYCVLLEILQLAVPGRGFEFVDIAMGWLGAFLGFGRRT